MPRQPQSEEDRARVRQRIVEAARTLFDESGFEAVSMRAIGLRVGLTASALYGYFPSKSDLVRGIWSEALADLGERLRGISEANPDPLQAICALGSAYAAFALEDRVRFRVLFLWTNDAIRNAPEENHGPYNILLGRVQQAIAQGLVPNHDDADLLAQIFWSAIHGVVALQIACTDFTFRPAPLLVETMIATVAAGLLSSQGGENA